METYSTLLLATQNMVTDDSSTAQNGLSTTPAFLTHELNAAIKDVFRLLKKYNLRPLPRTASSVANQTYYHNPPGMSKVESVTMTAGALTIPLRCIESQEEWDRLHQIPLSTSFPVAFFPRRDDVGIFPTPQSAGATITMVGNYLPTALTIADYVIGTVSISNNSTTLTGSGTTFTAAMVGRWFCLADSNGVPDGNWYRISAYTSATVLVLENYFQDTTVSGATYVIGQSPDCPEELHEFIPYRAASAYFTHRRRDNEQAQRLLNFYYTGDPENSNRKGDIRGGILSVLKDLRENGRANSQLTEIGEGRYSPQILGGIWSTVIS